MMEMLKQELKKLWYPPFVLLAVIGIVILCTFGECYMDENGATYMVLSVIFRRDDFDMDSLHWLHIWESGLGTWSCLFLPVLLSIGYLTTLSAERKSGNLRFLLIRSGFFQYGFGKVFGGAITSGAMLVLGYSLYGLLMLGIFPLRLIDDFGMELSVGGLILFILMRLLGMFLYGALIHIFCTLVSILFQDSYMLVCLPMMIKYIYTQVLQKIENGAIESGNLLLLERTGAFRLEHMIQMTFDKGWWMLLITMVIMYGMLGFFCGFSAKNRRDSGGWE